jgi:hypothetical protein
LFLTCRLCEIKPLSLAPRLETLDGKTDSLADGTLEGEYEFMVELQGWFSRNMPALKTPLRSKREDRLMHASELWAEF